MDLLQEKMLTLYNLISSISSYDHYGHGFNFYDEKQMQSMQDEKTKCEKKLNDLISLAKKKDPEVLQQWVSYNQNLLYEKITYFKNQNVNGSSSDNLYEIKNINNLIKAWDAVDIKSQFEVDLTAYWGLKIFNT